MTEEPSRSGPGDDRERNPSVDARGDDPGETRDREESTGVAQNRGASDESVWNSEEPDESVWNSEDANEPAWDRNDTDEIGDSELDENEYGSGAASEDDDRPYGPEPSSTPIDPGSVDTEHAVFVVLGALAMVAVLVWIAGAAV